jgi:hypothetical protein
MSWNYRLVERETTGGGTVYAIHEVYYGSTGRIKGWTAEPTHPMGETLGEFARDFAHYQSAQKRPILKEVGGRLVRKRRKAQ